MIQFRASDDLMQLLNSLDSSKAQCFNPQDKIAIDAQLKKILVNESEIEISMEVAFSRLNNQVKSWLVTKFLPDFSNVKELSHSVTLTTAYNSAQATASTLQESAAATEAQPATANKAKRGSKFESLLSMFTHAKQDNTLQASVAAPPPSSVSAATTRRGSKVEALLAKLQSS